MRTTLIPDNSHIELDIPIEFVGRKIEITLSPLESPKDKKNTMGSFWGIISDETAKDLHEQVKKSRDEWERDI